MSNALFIRAAHDAAVLPYTLRESAADEVLLDVAAVGLCGSDLHYYKDGGIGSARIARPFVPGHEFAGRLHADLPERGLARGTLVAVDPNVACGHCAWCREGHANLCPNVRFIGAPPFDGAMTDRIWVPRSQVVPIPESFTAVEATMLEPLGVAIHAIDLAKPRLQERVALLGCGPIGLLVLQVLRIAGAGEILAVDPQPARRAMALRLGAVQAGAEVGTLDRGRGCAAGDRGDEFAGRVPGRGARRPDRRPGDPRRHPGRRHLHAAGRGGAEAGSVDQMGKAHG